MIKRENGKVYAFTEVTPPSTILKIDIYDRQCQLQYEYEPDFEDANWADYLPDIEKAIQTSIEIVKEKMMNNQNVIHSYQTIANEKLVQKNKEFLVRNEKLLAYLTQYEVY